MAGSHEKEGAGRPSSRSRKSPLRSKLVDDVFARRRVERLIELVESEQSTRKNVWKAVASHPLLGLLIALIPLIIFGTTFWKDSVLRREQQLFEHQSFYQNSISALSKALAGRNERGVLLKSALYGRLGTCQDPGLSEEYQRLCRQQLQQLIYERKKDYDAAYLHWLSNYNEYLHNIERLFEEQHDDAYTEAYKSFKRLILDFNKSALRRMDSCLTLLYKKYQRTGTVEEVHSEPDCSDFDKAKEQVRECGTVLAEQLHQLVARVFDGTKQRKRPSSSLISAKATDQTDPLGPIREECYLPDEPETAEIKASIAGP